MLHLTDNVCREAKKQLRVISFVSPVAYIRLQNLPLSLVAHFNMLKSLVDMFPFIMNKWKHRLRVYLSPETSPVSKVQKSPEHKVHSQACLLSDKQRRTRQTSTVKLEKLREM